MQREWEGKWIGSPFGEKEQMPIFRKNIELRKDLKKAELFIVGLGQFEIRCNGQKVGQDVLKPAWTNYEKRISYSEYDMTACLKKGENVLGIMLGNGMYHVVGGRYTKFRRSFGSLMFLAELELEYSDGTKEKVISDTSFQTALGPITFSCTYGGEDYDKNLEIEGWDTAGMTETKAWRSAIPMIPPKGELFLEKNPPLRVQEILTGEKLWEKDGEVVFDTKKNLSGFVFVRAIGEKGCVIRITPYEMFNKEGELSQQFTGGPHYYDYTFAGKGEESWEPRFTYYGFRYIKIQVLRGAMPKFICAGGKMICPEIKLKGGFCCSEELWNKIHEIITRAILCNTKTIFTDCPHREKLGWLEQIHLIGPGIFYNYELHDLFSKVLDDIREAQTESGLIPDIAPEYVNFSEEGTHTGFRDSPEWGSAGILTPWYLYQEYHEREFLQENYDVMKKYLFYLAGKSTGSILHHGLGDWCDFGINPPFAQNTAVPITATAIYYYDLTVMEKVAKVLGKKEDGDEYHKMAVRVKEAFNREFFDSQVKRYGTGSQTANSMALFLGLVDEPYEGAVLENLLGDIERRGYHNTGGDVGYPFLIRALMKYNKNSVAAKMLLQRDAPSYGYQIDQGATTLCEEWNGNDPKNPRSSQNHFMLGAAEEWFYSGVAGFRNIHEQQREGQIQIYPYFPENLEWMKAWHEFKEGKLEIAWEKRGEEIIYHIAVPKGVQVCLKTEDEGFQLKENTEFRFLEPGEWELIYYRKDADDER